MAYGIEKGSLLAATTDSLGASLVPTTCTANGTCYLGSAEFLSAWIAYFVLKNATADITNITHQEFDSYFHSSVQQYSNIGTNDPDLTAFRARGGKLIGYHGLV